MYPVLKINECPQTENTMTFISKNRGKNLSLFAVVALSERSVYKQISQEFTFPTTKNNFFFCLVTYMVRFVKIPSAKK